MSESGRVFIAYGGSEYLIPHSTVDEVLGRIGAATSTADGGWLRVTVGQGRSTAAHLFIGRGIPIAVWQANTDTPPAERHRDGEIAPHPDYD